MEGGCAVLELNSPELAVAVRIAADTDQQRRRAEGAAFVEGFIVDHDGLTPAQSHATLFLSTHVDALIRRYDAGSGMALTAGALKRAARSGGCPAPWPSRHASSQLEYEYRHPLTTVSHPRARSARISRPWASLASVVA